MRWARKPGVRLQATVLGLSNRSAPVIDVKAAKMAATTSMLVRRAFARVHI